MADVTITIPLPVLVAGQSFYVRYREIPGGTWIVLPEQDNDPFVISGVNPGQYEVEFSVLQGSPIVACDPVSQYFTVPFPIDCIDASVDLRPHFDVWTLRVTYTYPSPFIAACYYELEYGPAGNTQTLTYQYLPPSPIDLPATGATQTVVIRAYDCDGNGVECFNGEAEPPVEECEHATLVSATITHVGDRYYLTLVVNPSVPASATYDITFFQYGTMLSGVPDPGNTFTVTVFGTTPEQFIFPINPNLNVEIENGSFFLHYEGTIVDDCNYSTKFNADYEL